MEEKIEKNIFMSHQTVKNKTHHQEKSLDDGF